MSSDTGKHFLGVSLGVDEYLETLLEECTVVLAIHHFHLDPIGFGKLRALVSKYPNLIPVKAAGEIVGRSLVENQVDVLYIADAEAARFHVNTWTAKEIRLGQDCDIECPGLICSGETDGIRSFRPSRPFAA